MDTVLPITPFSLHSQLPAFSDDERVVWYKDVEHVCNMIVLKNPLPNEARDYATLVPSIMI